jgi:hypothetical protein
MVVLKMNGKLKICLDFRKLNKGTKKILILCHFFDEVLNTIIGYEAYSFQDGYSRYHQNSIAPEERYKTTFVTN